MLFSVGYTILLCYVEVFMVFFRHLPVGRNDISIGMMNKSDKNIFFQF